MTKIYLPTTGPDDWQRFLADPVKQWKTGYSARTLAYCWHATNGFPPEVQRVFASSPAEALKMAQPLLILPEHKVKLKGRGLESQNDIFVLAKAADGELVSIMVEGKVNESFGQTSGKWKASSNGFSDNKRARLDDLQNQLGLAAIPDDIYYQLLHRTASAMIEARRFNARYAVMLVHSFSLTATWFEEYARFVQLFGHTAQKDTLQHVNTVAGVELFTGWVTGDARFLEM